MISGAQTDVSGGSWGELDASAQAAQALFTHLVFQVPVLRIAHGTEPRYSHPPSPDSLQRTHGNSFLSESLQSVASPRISAHPQHAYQGRFRSAVREDMTAQHKSVDSKRGSSSGTELRSTLTIQVRSDDRHPFPVVVCGHVCVM